MADGFLHGQGGAKMEIVEPTYTYYYDSTAKLYSITLGFDKLPKRFMFTYFISQSSYSMVNKVISGFIDVENETFNLLDQYGTSYFLESTNGGPFTSGTVNYHTMTISGNDITLQGTGNSIQFVTAVSATVKLIAFCAF